MTTTECITVVDTQHSLLISPFVAEEARRKNLPVNLSPVNSETSSVILFESNITPERKQRAREAATQWLARVEEFKSLNTKRPPSWRSSNEFNPIILLRELYNNASLETGGKDNLAVEILLTVLPHFKLLKVNQSWNQEYSEKPALAHYPALVPAVEEFHNDATNKDIFAVRQRLEALGNNIYDELIKPYVSSLYFSRPASRRRSFPSSRQRLEDFSEYDDFDNGIVDGILHRDGRRCLVSRELEEQTTKLRTRAESSREVKFSSLDATYIIPLTLDRDASNINGAKQSFWALADILDPGLRNIVWEKGLDEPDNGLTLSPKYFYKFCTLRFWLTAVSTESPNEHVYEVEHIPEENNIITKDVKSKTVTFRQGGEDGGILPNPRYLALHRLLGIAANRSGAIREIRSILSNDVEETLHEDGRDADVFRLILMAA
ncbi:hypothetical protein TWF694_008435 [Orbilia ellipsospora]|uniref:HNH nuclease domain-containing protein n=1 Tax=Orbilia ellipsospora TaxID=2528407 RepID=A0AAV9XJI4_9PEZI